MYLDEMQELLWAETGREYPISTICTTLRRYNYTRRKLRAIMIRRDFVEEANFIEVFGQYPGGYFLFGDESRKDPRALDRSYGRGVCGTRTTVLREWGRSLSFSAFGLLGLGGMVDCHVSGVRGVDAELFLEILYFHVLPYLRPFPNENSILVLDNASIHHDPRVRQMVESTGARLVYLPPYANNLNPIEEAFSKAKLWLQRNRAVAESDPKWALTKALMSITHADAAGYFQHAGYHVTELVPGLLYV
jgi:transposase